MEKDKTESVENPAPVCEVIFHSLWPPVVPFCEFQLDSLFLRLYVGEPSAQEPASQALMHF